MCSKFLTGLLVGMFVFVQIAGAAYTPPAVNLIGAGVAEGPTSPIANFPANSMSSRVMLHAGIDTFTSNNFHKLIAYQEPPNGAEYQYKVSATKTLYCFSMRYSTGGALHLLFGFSVNALASENTSSAPTGAVYYGASNDPIIAAAYNSGGGTTYKTKDIMYKFPANTYPFVKVKGTPVEFHVELDCIEY